MSSSRLSQPENTSVLTSALAQPRTLLIAAGLAGVMGAASVAMNVGDLGSSVPALTRVALGVFGVVAAAMLVTRPRMGWLLVLTWAALQIPVIALNLDGNAFEQVTTFAVSATSQTTANGVVTSFSEYGVNIIGIALVVLVSRWRNAWERQQWAAPDNRRTATAPSSSDHHPDGGGAVCAPCSRSNPNPAFAAMCTARWQHVNVP